MRSTGTAMLQILAATLALVVVALPAGRSFGLHSYCNSVGGTCVVPSSPQSKTSHTFGHIWGHKTRGLTSKSVGAKGDGNLNHRSWNRVCVGSTRPSAGALFGSTPACSSAPSTSPPSLPPAPLMSTRTGEKCARPTSPAAADMASKGRKSRLDTNLDSAGGDGVAHKGSKPGGGGGQGGEGHGGNGGRNGKEGGNGNILTAVTNSTDTETRYGHSNKSSGGYLPLESGAGIDEGLVRRSPLFRSMAPLWKFFRSRAGLYGIMLGYVVFTLSQHISPVFVGMSILTVLGPSPARKLLVLATQSLTVLTVASYIQDQFRHQVYPLPSVASGPSAPYAIITGGSSGIGREIANELAGRGYNVLLVARGAAGLMTAAKELEEASRSAAEAAQQEPEDGQPSPSRPESRRAEKRRLRRERKERVRRRSASASPSPSPSPSASTAASSPPAPSKAASEKGDASGRQDPATGLSSNSSDSSARPQGDERCDQDQEGEQDHGHQQQHQQQQRPLGGRGTEERLGPHVTETITARWLAADLGNATAVQDVYSEVQRLNLTVDILVNAAGVCSVGRVEKCADEELNAQLMLNVVGTSRLTRLFAKDFAARRKGRIMMVSSVVSAAPNPTVAAYAASKSYLTSFAEALHSELEVSGVGVTCVMPGATRTSFQDNSGSGAALVWQLPLFSMEADEVAARAVEALLRGDRTVVPGWQNKLYVHVLAPLLPRKIVMTFAEAMWR